MATVVTYSGKGSSLSFIEVDANWNNLNNFKVEKSSNTGSAGIPAGTSAQQDGSPVVGAFRGNTTTSRFEGYIGGSWKSCLTSVDYINNLTGANNTTLLGSIPYQSNTNVTSLLSPNTTTTKKFLTQTGTGTNGAAPVWEEVLNEVPIQTGNNGKILQTNGTVASWVAPPVTLVSTDDLSTNVDYFPAFFTTAGGTVLKTSSTKLTFNPSTGTLFSTEFLSSSDERLKDNINTLDNSLSTINSIRPVSFNWKETGAKSYGVIAQELEALLPELVQETSDGMKQVKYDALIGFLIGSVKELSARVEALEQK